MQSITRRKAIKRMGYLSSSLALMSLGATKILPPEKKLGVALVGLGNYATRQLGPALRHTQNCELRGIVTGTPEKEAQWQQEYGISPEHTYNYQTFDRLAKDKTIDIVYIVLPNFMHAEYTIRALEAGKHVICEKPMGMNAAECKAMIAAAKKAQRKLQIGYRLFYEPHHLQMIQLAQGSFDGRIRLIESSLGFDMAHPGMWRIDKDKGGGGALMDLGPYCIQAARRVVGTLPEKVEAQAFVDDPEMYKGIYGTYSWQLSFADKTVCNTSATFSAYVDRFHVANGNQFWELSPAFAANDDLKIRTRSDVQKLPVAEFQQTTQMDAFAENILNNTPVVASGEEGLIDMQIIDAIKQSIATGKTIDIDYS